MNERQEMIFRLIAYAVSIVMALAVIATGIALCVIGVDIGAWLALVGVIWLIRIFSNRPPQTGINWLW